jgi:hypothetical protein
MLDVSGPYQELWVMKQFVGTISAALIFAAPAAQAGPVAPSGLGGQSLYRTVSDLDGPYYSEAPPPPLAPIPAPAPRYGYEPAPDYGYRPPAPVYGPAPDRPDGYRPDYGYAPAFLPVHEVYAIARDNGFSPLGAPRQRGATYVIAVLDRDGEDGRLVIDARSGRIIRFVPAFQWGEDYERMGYEPGRGQPGPTMPREGLDRLPAPTVIKADPRLLQPAIPVAPAVPHHENRTAALAPAKPAVPAVRPAASQTAAVAPGPEAKPAATPVAAEQKPASILPTEPMPPAQGLE